MQLEYKVCLCAVFDQDSVCGVRFRSLVIGEIWECGVVVCTDARDIPKRLITNATPLTPPTKTLASKTTLEFSKTDNSKIYR